MEPRFNRDFGDVRIHTDGQATRSAAAIDARAYTVGKDIVFASDAYRPHSPAGRRLLAHELAHTVQLSARSPSLLMRATAEDCSGAGKTNSDLLKVHDEAKKLLESALDKTKTRTARGDRTEEVKAALREWFKIDLDETGNLFPHARAFVHVKKALSSTFKACDKTSYECDEHGTFEVCKEGRNAVTLGNIHICPSWWDLPKDRKPIVLIHEWLHKYGRGVNRVFETYCWEKEFEKLPRDERIKMPDAYEGYVSLLSQGKGTC